MARLLSELSNETQRQIAILVGRSGSIELVIVGDKKGVTLPALSRYRIGIPRLRGLRLIHTHLQKEPLTQEDLTDLALLRLDMVIALTVNENGSPGLIYSAYLLPDNREKKIWEINPPVPLEQFDIDTFDGAKPRFLNRGKKRRSVSTLSIPRASDRGAEWVDFLGWIRSLEEEFQRGQRSIDLKGSKEKAILISVGQESREVLESSMEELKELAETCGVLVVDVMLQRPQKISPHTLIGEGKLEELLVKCMQLGVDLIIFDQNLTPGQIASISDRTELRVIDRAQLILDIFAQRAHTQEGKVQVELAQLKYLFPRLAKKTLALSRLTGGIGGRGPGETKLEIDRRRVRERIHLLERELEKLAKRREQRRARRKKAGIPIISIIGYTNAGKTTLFNLLTKSQFHVEERLFSTLDTGTRRLRFPNDLQVDRKNHEMVFTDTVGFMKDLPKDLIGAFRPTFDELQESDLLIHLVDISNPCFHEHIEAVKKILIELGLDGINKLLVFNKEDKLTQEEVKTICKKYGGISISSLRPDSLEKLLNAISRKLWEGRYSISDDVRLTKAGSFGISN